MRRGCLFGCAGWLIACVAIGVLGWFVVLPRVTNMLENSLSEGISTMIADEINPLYSRSQLQQGADIRLSFDTINRSLRSSNDDGTVDSVVITSSGSQLIIQADINSQTFDVAFEPRVSSTGQLELQPVDDDGWWQRQLMGVLSGGFENAINDWLDRNDLRLVDVSLDGDTLVLSVTGN